ncbi:MAG: metal ABC transporter substrate-binding protein [Nitrospiraceae bacterium]|nr:metal ABC transporter substrate-binding protein [Nitrospiraceae bacterium]
MKKSYLATVACGLVFLIFCAACRNTPAGGKQRLSVVASLFPVYDFARQIARDRADVTLLLPPGTEPHSFDPRPADIITLTHADLFFYTNIYMEPWVQKILAGITSARLLAVDTSTGIRLMEAGGQDPEDEDPGHGHDHGGKDPHIWLDPLNAIRMVENIRDGLIRKDPSNREFYTRNAEEYVHQLQGLDSRFTAGLADCRKKVFVSGGHFTFGYLARRYGLTYVSAYGISPNSEPTPGSLASISRTLKDQGLRYIFYEELLSPRTAETIAKETDAKLLKLNGAHNITKEDFEKGTTFLSLMERNLANLRTGLECR